MFRALNADDRFAKSVCIEDTATDMTLSLDTDDVNSEDVTPENIARIVKALNTSSTPDGHL